jgi:tetratricopeptide (TPR) repeat protein
LARILAESDKITAEKHYRLAIDLHGDFVIRYHLPGHHTRQGDILKDFAALLHRRGSISESRHLLERAIEQYQEELKRRKSDPTALNNLAWLLTTVPFPELRDADRAVELAKKAVEKSPQNGSTWTTLGLAQYRAADWSSAVAALEKSIKLRHGGDSRDWFFLAMAHWQLGEKEQSRKWYAKAVQWMDKNRAQDEELRCFRAEATALLSINDPSKIQGKEVSPKKE